MSVNFKNICTSCKFCAASSSVTSSLAWRGEGGGAGMKGPLFQQLVLMTFPTPLSLTLYHNRDLPAWCFCQNSGHIAGSNVTFSLVKGRGVKDSFFQQPLLTTLRKTPAHLTHHNSNCQPNVSVTALSAAALPEPLRVVMLSTKSTFSPHYFKDLSLGWKRIVPFSPLSMTHHPLKIEKKKSIWYDLNVEAIFNINISRLPSRA